MGFVYLIGERDNDNFIKIGATKKTNIEDRIHELQTGNSEELYLRDCFETNHPFKLEASLHQLFHPKQVLNEWYQLTKEDINNFHDICQLRENNFKLLEDNPFFNKDIKQKIDFQY